MNFQGFFGRLSHCSRAGGQSARTHGWCEACTPVQDRAGAATLTTTPLIRPAGHTGMGSTPYPNWINSIPRRVRRHWGTCRVADITGTDLFRQTWLRTAVAGARYSRWKPAIEAAFVFAA